MARDGKPDILLFPVLQLWPDTTALTPMVYNMIKSSSEKLHKRPLIPKDKDELKTVDLDLYQPHITLEQLHGIKCPALTIGGDHDGVPVLHTVLIAQNIPRSYLWIVPNSGHMVPIKRHKEMFNAEIAQFFSQPYRIPGLFD